MTNETTNEPSQPSKCELRPGIGPCDSCGLPKWPQQYEGCGFMICSDCIDDFTRKDWLRTVMDMEAE